MLEELDNVSAKVYDLTDEQTKDWRQLIRYGAALDLDERRKFLWVWPNEKNLHDLRQLLGSLEIRCILSVGCGNGLLEWLLKESIGIEIYGLEVDKCWWQSNYAVKSFIKLNFIDDINNMDKNCEFLQQCCQVQSWNFALLFCFFNNRAAFLDYLQMYKGDCIIIIGPKPELGIHTDPQPLTPEFPVDKSWYLRCKCSIGVDDVLAIYTKIVL